jgi:hypothetical protein
MKTLFLAGAVLALACVLGGCSQRPEHPVVSAVTDAVGLTKAPAPEPILCANKPFTEKDLDLASLKVISVRLDYIAADEYDTITPQQLASSREKLKKLREFTASLTDERIKAVYAEWMDSYQRNYDEAADQIRARIAGKPADTKGAREEATRKEQERRAKELAKCLPVPK